MGEGGGGVGGGGGGFITLRLIILLTYNLVGLMVKVRLEKGRSEVRFPLAPREFFQVESYQ